MSRLLKFEFRKLFRQKSFYICCAVLAALVLLSIITGKLLTDALLSTADGLNVGLSMSDIGGFGLSGFYYLMTALSISDITLITAIFVALFVCADYSEGTTKNIIARGFSRTQYLIAKYVVVFAATLMMGVIAYIAAFVGGSLVWGVGSGWEWSALPILLTQLLVLLAFSSVLCTISFLVRNKGGAIAIGILTPLIVDAVLSLIKAILGRILGLEGFNHLTDYWLINCLNSVSGVPKMIESSAIIHSAICSAVYLVVFMLLSYLVTRKRDI